MSPPIRSNYPSPVPRANSTPPTNQHHLNHQQQQMDQLVNGMSSVNMNDKVSDLMNVVFYYFLFIIY